MPTAGLFTELWSEMDTPCDALLTATCLKEQTARKRIELVLALGIKRMPLIWEASAF